jgi:spore maturation protein CgeB
MKIKKVIFLGKSKRKTGNTRFMLKGLRNRDLQADFVNVPRYRKMYFWSDYKQHIHRKIVSFNPDLVLIYSKDIPFEVLQKIKSRFVTAMFYPDVFSPPEEKMVRYARETDYLFITNKRQIPELKSMGVRNPVFCWQGCDSDEHRIIPTRNPKWASQVAFIGRPSTEYRRELLEVVNRAFQLKTWGARWGDFGYDCPKVNIYPAEYARICYASDIMLGCDRSLEMDYNTSNRTWITLGCGGFLLTNYQRGLEDMFIKGKHLEWYHDTAECLEMIEHYLQHPDERREIAAAGHEFAHARRTYDIVMDEIISHIENDRP